jgi:hypothetical protein
VSAYARVVAAQRRSPRTITNGTGTPTVDLDVIARNTAATSSFTRIDAHVESGNPCPAWGMITPSS